MHDPGMEFEWNSSGGGRLRILTHAAGQMTRDAKFRGLRYEYDADGKMRRTTNLDGGAETTSVYDGLGQRVLNTVSGEAHHSVYDVMGRIISEYGPQGWERDRIYRNGQLLATEEARGTCRKTVEQLVESFYRGALDRSPTAAEKEHWTVRLRNAQGQSHAALLTEARALGRTLFESVEYAGRGRSDEEFVTDLYWGYLQRAPDAGGYLYWLNRVRTEGRSVVLTSFGESIEFDANVRGLCETNEVTGERHWALTDHVGSVRVITNEQGEVVGRRDNLPFGQAVLDVGTTEGGGAQASMSMSAEGSASSTGLWTWHNTIRTQFAQMEKDAGTGLDHTPFRKYESGLARWTSPDPYPGSMSLTDPQTLNRYAYVSNDPVNFVDPSGLDGEPRICDGQGNCYPWEPPLTTTYGSIGGLPGGGVGGLLGGSGEGAFATDQGFADGGEGGSLAGPQDTYGWKGAVDMDKNRSQQEGLSKCVKDFLGWFFDRKLLDQITVREGYVPRGNDAITFNNHVTFRKGRLDQKTWGGILLIAHEVQHSVQYQALGTRVFLTLYGMETARLMSDPAILALLAANPSAGQRFIHDSLSLEKEASKKERKVADSYKFTEKDVVCP